MFDWESWVDGKSSVYIRTVEDVRTFLRLVKEQGLFIQAPTELYEECVNTYYVYDNGVYVTSINERRIAFEYQDVFAYNYTFPSNASLMEFLED